MLQAELIAKIETPTTQKKENGEPLNAIGTGYPIQEGLVLTASHVLDHKDRDSRKKRKVIWRKEDEDTPYLESQFEDSDIVFESKKFDIALIRCKTPLINFPKPILHPDMQAPRDKWESMGYPTIGKDIEQDERIKTPVDGGILKNDPDYYIQQLRLDVDADKLQLWRGLSGAPVFNKDTNQLIAVITHIPEKYLDEDGNEQDRFKNILLATSIPYLLTDNKCPEFRNFILDQREENNLLPKEKLGVEFSDYLVKQIIRIFRGSGEDVSYLCEGLVDELDIDTPTSSKVYETIARTLIKKIRPNGQVGSDQDVEMTIDSLSNAASECVIKGGVYYKQVSSKDDLKDCSQQILGWLVLASIRDDELNTIISRCTEHDSLFFTLAVQSLTGVEVVMARRFNHVAHFEHDSNVEPKGRHLIGMPKSCFKWDKDESVRKIFIEIWNKVFPKNKIDDTEQQVSQKMLKRLNAELRKRRRNSKKTEHYYIPFNPSEYLKINSKAAKELSTKIYEDLLSKLQQMTVIQYGEEGNDCNLFVIEEEALQAAINDFYRTINDEKD